MQREFQDSSPGLSERIIAKALTPEKAPSKSLLDSIKEIFSVLPIPSPALAIPLILVLGIVAGYLIPTEYAASETQSTQESGIIYNYGGIYE